MNSIIRMCSFITNSYLYPSSEPESESEQSSGESDSSSFATVDAGDHQENSDTGILSNTRIEHETAAAGDHGSDEEMALDEANSTSLAPNDAKTCSYDLNDDDIQMSIIENNIVSDDEVFMDSDADLVDIDESGQWGLDIVGRVCTSNEIESTRCEYRTQLIDRNQSVSESYQGISTLNEQQKDYDGDDDEVHTDFEMVPLPAGRGPRSSRVGSSGPESTLKHQDSTVVQPKRGRGRPRKIPVSPTGPMAQTQTQKSAKAKPPGKRGRGRPRKVPCPDGVNDKSHEAFGNNQSEANTSLVLSPARIKRGRVSPRQELIAAPRSTQTQPASQGGQNEYVLEAPKPQESADKELGTAEPSTVLRRSPRKRTVKFEKFVWEIEEDDETERDDNDLQGRDKNSKGDLGQEQREVELEANTNRQAQTPPAQSLRPSTSGRVKVRVYDTRFPPHVLARNPVIGFFVAMGNRFDPTATFDQCRAAAFETIRDADDEFRQAFYDFCQENPAPGVNEQMNLVIEHAAR